MFPTKELEEEIYMKRPTCFEVKGNEHKVCCLKCLHMLKKSSREGNLQFNQAIISIGFK